MIRIRDWVRHGASSARLEETARWIAQDSPAMRRAVEAFGRQFDPQRDGAIGVWIDGSPVGFAAYSGIGDAARLRWLRAVNDGVDGSGLAEALLDRCLHGARRQGHRVMTVCSRRPKARALLDQAGFEPCLPLRALPAGLWQRRLTPLE